VLFFISCDYSQDIVDSHFSVSSDQLLCLSVTVQSSSKNLLTVL